MEEYLIISKKKKNKLTPSLYSSPHMLLIVPENTIKYNHFV